MQEWNTSEYQETMEREYQRIRGAHPDIVTTRFECLAGWYGIIEEYFDEVARLLAEHPGSTYDLRQIKEKFAGLRLYAGTSEDIRAGVQAAYDKASAAAKETCEVCGQPGVLHERGGWYATRCDDHADGPEAAGR
jgi:hypothetical protein